MPTGRSRPFVLTFQPNGADEAQDPYKNKVIPINAGMPVEVENAHFKGRVMLIHDTGNEPGAEGSAGEADAAKRRGVELQIQGKFKHEISKGEQSSSGIWAGGELQDQLKLGWIMNNVVQLCAKFARKKTEGRLHFNMGSKAEKPHLSFPVTQLFTYVATPPGSEPPRLGSPELQEVKWQGPEELAVDPAYTYTFMYSTPYLDLCSWELLKVPGVSPLPIESILGDLSTARVIMYDLGVAGSQANWRKGVLLEWYFVRGKQEDSWPEEEALISEGAKTPLEEASDPSEASELEEGAEEGAVLIAVDGEGPEDDESSSSDDSMGSDEEEELSRADSQALLEIEGWRPRHVSDSAVVRVPYYIEAIDRRRRRKVRVWYVFSMTNPEGGEDWWHAKAASELASLCRPRRRLQTFRRGPGARRYTCCAVRTLEQFRNVVSEHLKSETKLRSVVTTAAERSGTATPMPPPELPPEEPSAKNLTPAGLAQKVKRRRAAGRGPLVPPRFFVGGGAPACGLAFAHAREGRQSVVRETLVGVIHFEGRLCEELLRLSSDGILRCFTPYDCATPRVRLLTTEILSVERQEGLFLGRFHLWLVHTALRVFSFCSAEEEGREEWIAAIDSASTAAPGFAPTPGPGFRPNEARSKAETPASEGVAASVPRQVKTMTRNVIRRRVSGGEEVLPSDIAALLMDSTRARRWRQNKRLVLNDRRIISEVQPPPSSIVEGMLETVLAFGEEPSTAELVEFMDATCLLKAVRFSGWRQEELLAFWLNVYHCLLLHGWVLLGTPRSKSELARFYNRVSYLVGQRPVSLREIERVVLHVPKADPQAVRAQARARAYQLLGFCRCCRRRAGALRASPPRSPRADSDDEKRSGTPPAGSRGGKGRSCQPNTACLPMPPMPRLPQAPWSPQGAHSCLFLGQPPEAMAIPKQDLRAVVTFNRGNKSCISAIPVFHGTRLNSELNDVMRQFVGAFVQVQERDGKPIRVTLPHCCQGVKQELVGQLDPQAVLTYIWTFMPKDQARPTPKTQLKFLKCNEEMRRRMDITKAAYSDPNLSDASLAKPGKEFEVINATAQALARLPASPASPKELNAQEQLGPYSL